MLAELISNSLSLFLGKLPYQPTDTQLLPPPKNFTHRNNLFLILMDTPLPNRILVRKGKEKFSEMFYYLLFPELFRDVSLERRLPDSGKQWGIKAAAGKVFVFLFPFIY